MQLILTRYFESEVQTRGQLRLVDDGETIFSCYTLELPWKNNENQVSCIPTGEYTVRHRGAAESGSYDYDHFIVVDVQGRTYILIHAGNLYTHTLGCILVGEEFVDINDDGYPDVTGSRATLQKLRDLSGPTMDMTVRTVEEAFGGRCWPSGRGVCGASRQ